MHYHKQKKQKKDSPKKNKSKNKKKTSSGNRPVSGGGISWGSTEAPKEEPSYTQKNFYYIVAGMIFLLLFCLWAFVDDRPTIERRKQAAKDAAERANQTKSETSRKEFLFEYSNLMNSSEFQNIIKDLNDLENEDIADRIVLVAFDDSSREAEGNPTKVKLFRKFESIAKSIPRKKLFKRYNEDELPLVIEFDCGNPNDATAEQLCKQIIGENIPNVVIFRAQQQPRALPSDYKSDNQIITYLYNLMQPAVKYLEERNDCEDFVANDEQLNVVLFGEEKTGSFDQVADMLREFARFGKTKNSGAAEEFDAQMGSIMIWRTFGQNPIKFPGNISDAQSVHSFVMNHFLPIFGEFTPTTSNNYMKRGLPLIWIAYDRNEESTSDLLETIEQLAYRHIGQLSFVQLDTKAYPQIASNFGIDVKATNTDGDDEDEDEPEDDDEEDEEKAQRKKDSTLPQVFIMNQVAKLRQEIDIDEPTESVQKIIDEYYRQVKLQRGDPTADLYDDSDDEDDDDDEYEEDDEDDEEDEDEAKLEDDNEDEDDDEEEEEEEEQPPPDASAPGPPKQDL